MPTKAQSSSLGYTFKLPLRAPTSSSNIDHQGEPSSDSVAMMALLQQAEGLLIEVNAVRSRTTPRVTLQSDELENDQSNRYAVGAEMTSRSIPTSTLTQLDWLLRGLPEAYDDGDFDDMKEGPLDDLAVQKLIKEGGRPPSQLAFPSLYSMGQKIMNKLQKAKCLSITLNHMFIYSGRYGVRRHCSRLLIRPPRGCFIPENEPEAIIIDLPELLGRNLREVNQSAEILDKKKMPNALRSGRTGIKGTRNASYIPEGETGKSSKRRAATGVGPDACFVGGIDLQRTVLFPLEAINDRTLQSWLSGDGEGCIRIELQGHITPPYSGVSLSVKYRCSAASYIDVPQFSFLYQDLGK